MASNAATGSRLRATGAAAVSDSSVSVLSASDLARLKRTAFTTSSLLHMKSADEEADAAKRAARVAASKERTSKFPNTLLALRRRKEAAKAEAEAAEEMERLRVDSEEAALRQAERLRVLQAAHGALIENTDKMRLLRSQKLAAAVADTRVKQLALASRKKEMQAVWEREAHEAIVAAAAEAEAREAAAAAVRAERAATLAREQRVQLAETMHRHVAAAAAVRAEGERMAAAAAAAAAKEEADRAAARQRHKDATAHMHRVNVELQAMKAEAAKRAMAEAARNEEIQREKEAEAAARAAFVETKRMEAAEKARRIAEKVQLEFAAKEHNEEHRVAVAVAKAEAAEARTADLLRTRRAEMRSAIDEHRLTAQRQREEEQAAAAAEQAAQAARFADNLRRLQEADRAATEARRTRARETAAFQLAQMADKKRVIESTAEYERHVSATAAANAAGEAPSDVSDAFAAAAEALLAQERAKGRSTLALSRTIAKSNRDPLIAATALM